MVRLMAVLFGGAFLDGYILGIIGPLTSTISESLLLSALWLGAITAAVMGGIFLGAPLGGWAADRWGRKPVFTANLALFTAASVLQFFIDTPWLLCIVRVLMGIAIGCEYSVSWALLSEFVSAKIRGRLLSAHQIAWYVGFMVAYAVGDLLVKNTTLSWQVILGTSTFISLVVLILRIGMPESPRWLWSVGRKADALRVARKYMHDDAQVDLESEVVQKGRYADLFSRQHWRKTLFVCVYYACAIIPYFAIGTFAEDVLRQFGLSGGLAGGVGLSAVAVTGVVVMYLLIDRTGRRPLIVVSMWVFTAALAVISLWGGAPPVAVLVLFLIFSFSNAIPTAMGGVFPPELYPTEIRAKGGGFMMAVSRVAAGIGVFLFPQAIENLGMGETMMIATAIALVGSIIAQWLAPETRGLTLTSASGVHVDKSPN
ncbi:MFS transporter [Mycobacterium goodii]|nr:MFS transporter [Mycolicibacterium goodii]